MSNNLPTTTDHTDPPVREQQQPQRSANASKIHDNRVVYQALQPFRNYSELTDAHPRADCVLTGASWLMTAGHTATRPLARKVIFQILASSRWITTSAVAEATTWRAYSRTQLERYAAAARVASKGLHKVVAADSQAVALAEEQRRLDQPYLDMLQHARPATRPSNPFPHLIEEEPDRHLIVSQRVV